ncbi:hypothetical protein [Planomonospora sp. ID82291]|uniref:hypothetical protein n=1 Tax=Planomonospora sp. ID82291 TaxID=2738136 RepID=UPI0018C3E30C|nr:hypothetical protein [Planomonospora sp. ID82291]MBG0817552.1 hypothetical protein [Planomonospora sp. ID82291]
MKPDLKCVMDSSRPCGGCSASGPSECPYAYLLGAGEPDPVAEADEPGRSYAAR